MCFTDLPYSRESRALFPLWEELAEELEEREHVVIARIDASANDIDLSMQGSYPSLCLFPALHAERVRSVSCLQKPQGESELRHKTREASLVFIPTLLLFIGLNI